MIDEKSLFKFTFVIMLSISVAEKSVTLVDLFIVDKKECEKTVYEICCRRMCIVFQQINVEITCEIKNFLSALTFNNKLSI